MNNFDPGKVRTRLEKVYKQVQKWPVGEMKNDTNWLCSQLVQFLDEGGRVARENKRLRAEVNALRKK